MMLDTKNEQKWPLPAQKCFLSQTGSSSQGSFHFFMYATPLGCFFMPCDTVDKIRKADIIFLLFQAREKRTKAALLQGWRRHPAPKSAEFSRGTIAPPHRRHGLDRPYIDLLHPSGDSQLVLLRMSSQDWLDQGERFKIGSIKIGRPKGRPTW